MAAEKAARLITQEEYAGYQRELAWFKRRGNHLYFDAPCSFFGTHTSYHKDGNIFRTSLATENRAKLQSKHLPLKDFQGWYQLGIGVLSKSGVADSPEVSARHRKGNTIIVEIPLYSYPSQTMNFVVELLDPSYRHLLDLEDLAPPPHATGWIIELGTPWIVITILGHEANLLVQPNDDGFIVKHYNSRFSANLPGVEYTYEAYT